MPSPMPRLPALAVFAASVALAAAVPAQSLVANLNTGNFNNLSLIHI